MPCSGVPKGLFVTSFESFQHTQKVLYSEAINAVAPNTANIDPL